MWIQSTEYISREDAVNKALKVFAQRNRKFIENLPDKDIEEMIEEHSYNFKII